MNAEVDLTPQKIINIQPQPGKQTQFMSTSADICIYGGAAGGAKTHGLLLEAVRNYQVENFGAVIFRASLKQVKNQGGLWDSSVDIYPLFGAEPKVSVLSWVWNAVPSKITFAHLDTEDSVLDWQGSQIPLICCEENTHVIMANGSERALSDVRVGNYVKTLQGRGRVIKKGKRQLKDCVSITMPDGDTQIQSTNHEFLTPSGWVSYDTLDDNVVPVVRYLPGIQDKVNHKIQYNHPYNGSEQISKCSVLIDSCDITPVGKRWVIDLTIDVDNHYITGSGLVNKNCFDELTHFSRKQFFYMLSRNRSTCGVTPYVRASTNPDSDSWVRDLIDWWIGDDGYAIEQRSGIIRWFVNQNDQIHWFDNKQEALQKFPKIPPKSFTFISSNIHDNQILMKADPAYMANLEALSAVDRERLLNGNWNVRDGAGDYFKEEWFEIVDSAPDLINDVRAWDFAATEVSEANPDPDWTVGLKGGNAADGTIYITDMERERFNPTKVKQLVINTAMMDGVKTIIRIPQDPGSAGKVVSHDYIRSLKGFPVKAKPVTGKKEVRALPASSQAGVGNIKLVRGHWNNDFLVEVSGFPLAKHDDTVDTLSDLVDELSNINGRVFDDYEQCDSVVKEYENLLMGIVTVPEHVTLVVIAKRGRQLHVVAEHVCMRDTRQAINIIKKIYPTNSIEIHPSITGRSKSDVNSTDSDISMLRRAGFTVKSDEYEIPVKEIIDKCNEGLESKVVQINSTNCPTLSLALDIQQYNEKGLPDNNDNKFWIANSFSYPIYKVLKINKRSTTITRNISSNRIGGY